MLHCHAVPFRLCAHSTACAARQILSCQSGTRCWPACVDCHALQAYSPLCKATKLSHPDIVKVAAKCHKTPAQVKCIVSSSCTWLHKQPVKTCTQCAQCLGAFSVCINSLFLVPCCGYLARTVSICIHINAASLTRATLKCRQHSSWLFGQQIAIRQQIVTDITGSPTS